MYYSRGGSDRQQHPTPVELLPLFSVLFSLALPSFFGCAALLWPPRPRLLPLLPLLMLLPSLQRPCPYYSD
jgi:hypothetical protein